MWDKQGASNLKRHDTCISRAHADKPQQHQQPGPAQSQPVSRTRSRPKNSTYLSPSPHTQSSTRYDVTRIYHNTPIQNHESRQYNWRANITLPPCSLGYVRIAHWCLKSHHITLCKLWTLHRLVFYPNKQQVHFIFLFRDWTLFLRQRYPRKMFSFLKDFSYRLFFSLYDFSLLISTPSSLFLISRHYNIPYSFPHPSTARMCMY